MKKVDVDDFNITVKEDILTGLGEGTARYKDIVVYFNVVNEGSGKAVHFANPDILLSVGISQDEMEEEILSII